MIRGLSTQHKAEEQVVNHCLYQMASLSTVINNKWMSYKKNQKNEWTAPSAFALYNISNVLKKLCSFSANGQLPSHAPFRLHQLVFSVLIDIPHAHVCYLKIYFISVFSLVHFPFWNCVSRTLLHLVSLGYSFQLSSLTRGKGLTSCYWDTLYKKRTAQANCLLKGLALIFLPSQPQSSFRRLMIGLKVHYLLMAFY